MLHRSSDTPHICHNLQLAQRCAGTCHWLWPWRCRQACCCSGLCSTAELALAQGVKHWAGTGNTVILSSCRCYAAPQGRISASCQLLPLLAVTINCLQAASCRWLAWSGWLAWLMCLPAVIGPSAAAVGGATLSAVPGRPELK
jgi:hypothetical protein